MMPSHSLVRYEINNYLRYVHVYPVLVCVDFNTRHLSLVTLCNLWPNEVTRLWKWNPSIESENRSARNSLHPFKKTAA